MSIDIWCRHTTQRFVQSGIPAARLDVLLLLGHVLGKDKSWLLAHGDETLTDTQIKELDTLVERRITGEPIAYIIGYKEFYGRCFGVTRDVLVPRPESEAFIELLGDQYRDDRESLLDVGTGSGCLAISAALEFQRLSVTATDISAAALAVAQKNAETLQAHVTLVQSDLFAQIVGVFDYVFANLPYVPSSLSVSPDVRLEPHIAVFAGHDGLGVLRTFMSHVTEHLSDNGSLFLEYLDEQDDAIQHMARSVGLKPSGSLGMVHVYAKTPC